jgi:hypothetical protein
MRLLHGWVTEVHVFGKSSLLSYLGWLANPSASTPDPDSYEEAVTLR